jgi:hypothetical protein
MLTTARTTALTLALAALAAAPTAVLAKHGADDPVGDDHGGAVGAKGGSKATRVAGVCTDGSTAKLKVKPDDGRLELEFEVDQNRAGVTWSVRVRRDGVLVVRRNATTHAPSGSFSVERKVANPAGSDRIAARAMSPSGEVCSATLTV